MPACIRITAAVVLLSALCADAGETHPGTSSAPRTTGHSSIHQSSRVSESATPSPAAPPEAAYLPLIVSEGEPLYLQLSLPSQQPVAVTSGEDEIPFSIQGSNPTTMELTVSAGSYSTLQVEYSGKTLFINFAERLKGMSGASAHPRGYLLNNGAFIILRHKPRVVKESRKWLVIRKLARTLEARSLPDKILLIHPQDHLGHLADLLKEDSRQFTEAKAEQTGRSPLVGYLLSLASQHAEVSKAAKDAGVLLVLPPGEWDGGLPPGTYRRTVEWLLDSMAASGAKRMVLTGPVEAGPVPERIRAYRQAAASAAHSRRAYYIDTDTILEESDFRHGPRGPFGSEPSRAAQEVLGRSAKEALRMAKDLTPGRMD